MEKLYKIEEVAEILNFSTRSVERWIAEGRILTVRFGARAVRVHPDELNFIRSNGLRESHQVCAQSILSTRGVLVKQNRPLKNKLEGVRLWEN